MDKDLERYVRERAGFRCEYCLMPESAYATVVFPIDHIVARQHGGRTTLGNLAESCLPNIAGIDSKTRRLTRLYHPRRHKWIAHFRWARAVLEGRTKIGRTTIVVLALNDPDLVSVRIELFGDGMPRPSIE